MVTNGDRKTNSFGKLSSKLIDADRDAGPEPLVTRSLYIFLSAGTIVDCGPGAAELRAEIMSYLFRVQRIIHKQSKQSSTAAR